MKPYHSTPDTQFYVGNVLDVLRGLPENSVHCCVTSPPYWGLRDYQIPPVIWGGDSLCDHEWGDWQSYHREREQILGGKSRTTDRYYGRPSRVFNGNHQKHSQGCWCQGCGAWMGSLGLEPDLDMFLDHIVQVFREVRRVLCNDGTLWLNCGDGYAGSGKGRNADGTSSPGPMDATNQGRIEGELCFTGTPNGTKRKNLLGVPWRVAFALQADGWYLRQDVVWFKPNAMPESVTDRPTKAHEYVFLFSKRPRYFYDAEAIKEDVCPETHTRGPRYHPTPKETPEKSRIKNNSSFRETTWGLVEKRNKRSVWEVPTFAFSEAHFATFPPNLVKPCILASTSEKGCCPECGKPWIRKAERTGHVNNRKPSHVPRSNGTQTLSTGWAPVYQGTGKWLPGCKCGIRETIPGRVLDPFGGAGTTALVARQLGRHSVYIDLSQKYVDIAIERLEGQALPLPLLNVL